VASPASEEAAAGYVYHREVGWARWRSRAHALHSEISLSLSLSLSLSHIILRLRLFFMCPLLHHDQPYLIYSPIWDNFGCDHMASSWVSLQQTLELVERELIKRVCVCVERQACVSKNLVKFS